RETVLKREPRAGPHLGFVSVRDCKRQPGPYQPPLERPQGKLRLGAVQIVSRGPRRLPCGQGEPVVMGEPAYLHHRRGRHARAPGSRSTTGSITSGGGSSSIR